MVLPLIGYGTLVVGAVLLGRASTTALFLVAAVTLTLIFIGIHNAWDTVAYVATELRAKNPE